MTQTAEKTDDYDLDEALRGLRITPPMDGPQEHVRRGPALSIEDVQEDNSVLYLKSRRTDLAAMEAEVSELDVEIATIGNRIKADQQRLAEKIKQRSDTVFLKSVIEDSIQQLKARGV